MSLEFQKQTEDLPPVVKNAWVERLDIRVFERKMKDCRHKWVRLGEFPLSAEITREYLIHFDSALCEYRPQKSTSRKYGQGELLEKSLKSS